MKKRKREKLDQIRREKREAWERIRPIQEREDAIVQLLIVHFFSGKYGCEHCADFHPDICEGKGHMTFDECYDCMEEKYENGEEISGKKGQGMKGIYFFN